MYPTTQTRANGPWNSEVGYGLVDAYRATAVAAYGLTISGPDRPIPQSYVDYTVPSSLPAGVSFTGWEITPGTSGTTYWAGGTSSTTLHIAFRATALFTLKANFPYSAPIDSLVTI